MGSLYSLGASFWAVVTISVTRCHKFPLFVGREFMTIQIETGCDLTRTKVHFKQTLQCCDTCLLLGFAIGYIVLFNKHSEMYIMNIMSDSMAIPPLPRYLSL